MRIDVNNRLKRTHGLKCYFDADLMILECEQSAPHPSLPASGRVLQVNFAVDCAFDNAIACLIKHWIRAKLRIRWRIYCAFNGAFGVAFDCAFNCAFDCAFHCAFECGLVQNIASETQTCVKVVCCLLDASRKRRVLRTHLCLQKAECCKFDYSFDSAI